MSERLQAGEFERYLSALDLLRDKDDERQGIRLLVDSVDVEAALEEIAEASRREPAPHGVVLEDDFVLVLRDAVRFPGGHPGLYLRVIPKPIGGLGAVVIPVLPDGRVVWLSQFRHATRQTHLQLPRGFADPGDDQATTARRELEEELGAQIIDLQRLGTIHPDTGLLRSSVSVWVAQIDEVRELEETEGILGSHAASIAETRRMISAGEITDGISLAALMLAEAESALD